MAPETTTPTDQRQEDKSLAIRDVEENINYALMVWGFDDDAVRRILLTCRTDLRAHLEGATT
jgi:hypothetical protein